LFYVDDPQASLVEIPPGSPADLSKIPVDKEWLLLIGAHAPPPGNPFELAMNGFSIFRIAGTGKIDFTRKSWPGVLSRAQGLSHAEAWGTWSDGSTVTLDFVTPLPRKLILHLTARAFGPNVGRNFTIRIGSETTNVVLTDSPRDIAIPFQNLEAATSIKISVPNPISPQELGLGEDVRQLGIALYQLRVDDITQQAGR
jgi:phosphoglycerol transferase